MDNILVIYDQLDSELQYILTEDEDFLKLDGARINSSSTPKELQFQAYDKLFDEDGEKLIQWQPLAQLTSNILPPIKRIVYIAFIP